MNGVFFSEPVHALGADRLSRADQVGVWRWACLPLAVAAALVLAACGSLPAQQQSQATGGATGTGANAPNAVANAASEGAPGGAATADATDVAVAVVETAAAVAEEVAEELAAEVADPQAGQAPLSFTVQVRSSQRDIAKHLERHLALQRYVHFPDLRELEFNRLMAEADTNARDLLAALGYFNPQLELRVE